jgi:hypothetical protein
MKHLISAVVAALAFACSAQVAAQVVTAPAELIDSDGKNGIRLVTMAAKVTPPQRRNTVVIRCPNAPGWAYAVEGTPCPTAPLRIIDGADRNGAVKLTAYPGSARVVGAYRAIETTSATVADGIVIDGLHAEELSRGGVRLRGKLSNITVRNSTFRFRAEPQVSPHLPACMEVDSVQGLLVQNVTCDGFLMTMEPNRYWNGDGPTFEDRVTGLVLDNVTSRNSTDGCFDIKPVFRATRIVAGGCKRLFRTWKGGEVDELVLETPIKRGGTGGMTGIWMKGSNTATPTLHIRKLVVRYTTPAPIISAEDGRVNVTIDACDIQAPAGTTLKLGGSGGKLTLGPGCRVP